MMGRGRALLPACLWTARRRPLLCALALALTPLACSGTKTPTGSSPVVQPSTPLSVSSLTVTGTAPIVGASVQFDATAAMSNGTTNSVTSQAAWSSSDSSVAAVSAAGVVRAVAAGDADIVATYQSISGRLHITVGATEGLRSDTIQVGHDFIVGTPAPTMNQSSTYCCWPLQVLNAGSYRYNLDAFPANLLPSGGSSNVLSASEMLMVGVHYASVATSATMMTWHKAVGADTVIFTYRTGGSHDWVYSYIGHFSWEISEPGAYYLVIDSPFGSARMDFTVTGSRTSVLTERDAVGTRVVVPKGGFGIDRTILGPE
jgi:hypothetical protein